MKRLCGLFAFAVFAVFPAFSEESISFTFSITGKDAATSAGVYDSTGALVRTLWSGVTYPPGTYTRSWDGKLDYAHGGRDATSGATYTIKLLTSDVKYTYDGHIGTTSEQWYLPNKWEMFSYNTSTIPMTTFKLAFAGKLGWIASYYAEGDFNFGFFHEGDPNTPYTVSDYYVNQSIDFSDLTTDGSRVYFMNVGAWNGPSLVTAVDASSGALVSFTMGTDLKGFTCPSFPASNCGGNPVPGVWNNAKISYIDYNANGVSVPSGVAVQRKGNILAVAHGSLNAVKLFDKISGSSLGTVSGIANPTQMAFNSEGLWVVSNGSLYLVTHVGSTNTVTRPLTGFSNVVGVGTNGSTNSLLVLDGGTKQQMIEYAVTSHRVMRIYGTLGGYHDCNPTITNNRLLLDMSATTGSTVATVPNSQSSPTNLSWVAVDDSDNVWIGEGPNLGRVLHISPANTYVNQILIKRPNYHIGISDTLPTRIFMDLFEYKVNYDVPVNPGDPDTRLGGNGSWGLVRNWAVCSQGAHGSTAYGGRPSVLNFEKLSNGNVYAQVITGPNTLRLYQLPNSGAPPMRDTGTSWPIGGPTGWNMLLRDGSLGYLKQTGAAPNIKLTAYHASLKGFDSNSNPMWSAFSEIGSALTTNENAPILMGSGWGVLYSGGDSTTSGYIPVFSSGVHSSASTTEYPHLYAIKNGYAGYVWNVLPEVCMKRPDFHGSFPCGLGYGGHNGTGPVRVEGKNIFAAYDGQYALWGAQFYHFWEDGLFIGQFGNSVDFSADYTKPSHPCNAGNIAMVGTTIYKGDIYFYNSDEGWAPMHRWHISNLNSIHEYSGSTVFEANARVNLTRLF